MIFLNDFYGLYYLKIFVTFSNIIDAKFKSFAFEYPYKRVVYLSDKSTLLGVYPFQTKDKPKVKGIDFIRIIISKNPGYLCVVYYYVAYTHVPQLL